MVAIKVAAVIFVIVVGANYINFDNYTPFAPYGWTGLTFFGHPLPGTQLNAGGEPVGVIAGAAIIFFAYIGFDAVSTTQAEEAKNPKRDIPFGIIVSLLVCTILYIAVVAVLTGMVKYDVIDKGAGVSSAFKTINLGWAEGLIAIAGVAGITSVLLVMMLSAPRVFLAMARDGLLPTKFFADVHPQVPDPLEEHHCSGCVCRHRCGYSPHRCLATPDEHRHLVCLCDRVCCGAGDAEDESQCGTPIPLPTGTSCPCSWHSDVSDHDVLAASRQLAATDRLAGHRVCHLLPLWHPSQQAQATHGCGTSIEFQGDDSEEFPIALDVLDGMIQHVFVYSRIDA
jgi:hypothetical protein